MNKRTTLTMALVACMLLVAFAFAVVACGSNTETTTTAAPATTTSAAATTTTATAPATSTSAGATNSTAAGSFTLPSIQMTPEIETYIQQMTAVFGSLQSLPEEDKPFSITDISQVTDAQIKTFEDAMTQMKAALEGLKALKPPADLAPFQEALTSLVSNSIDIGGKALDAMKNKDQAAFDAAKAESDKLETQMTSILAAIMPLMMGGTATS
jgi:hypothetical protein